MICSQWNRNVPFCLPAEFHIDSPAFGNLPNDQPAYNSLMCVYIVAVYLIIYRPIAWFAVKSVVYLQCIYLDYLFISCQESNERMIVMRFPERE